MALADWGGFADGGTTYTLDVPAIAGSWSLRVNSGNALGSAQNFARWHTAGNVLNGKIRSLAKPVNPGALGPLISIFGMLQGVSSLNYAYHLVVGNPGYPCTTWELHKSNWFNNLGLNLLVSGPLGFTLNVGGLVCLELEWQTDLLNSLVVLYPRFGHLSDFSDLTQGTSYTDHGQIGGPAYNASFGAGVSCYGKDSITYFDNTSIYGP